ncbi:hypothetical protein MMC25_007642 [Agyrium rufum]|nr:hypothetical protein [Agyrium rufum]
MSSIAGPSQTATVTITKHVKFHTIKVHTAKCDYCDQKNKSILYRCVSCDRQYCTPCIVAERLGSRHNRLHGVGDLSTRHADLVLSEPRKPGQRIELDPDRPRKRWDLIAEDERWEYTRKTSVEHIARVKQEEVTQGNEEDTEEEDIHPAKRQRYSRLTPSHLEERSLSPSEGTSSCFAKPSLKGKERALPNSQFAIQELHWPKGLHPLREADEFRLRFQTSPQNGEAQENRDKIPALDSDKYRAQAQILIDYAIAACNGDSSDSDDSSDDSSEVSDWTPPEGYGWWVHEDGFGGLCRQKIRCGESMPPMLYPTRKLPGRSDERLVRPPVAANTPSTGRAIDEESLRKEVTCAADAGEIDRTARTIMGNNANTDVSFGGPIMEHRIVNTAGDLNSISTQVPNPRPNLDMLINAFAVVDRLSEQEAAPLMTGISGIYDAQPRTQQSTEDVSDLHTQLPASSATTEVHEYTPTVYELGSPRGYSDEPQANPAPLNEEQRARYIYASGITSYAQQRNGDDSHGYTPVPEHRHSTKIAVSPRLRELKRDAATWRDANGKRRKYPRLPGSVARDEN